MLYITALPESINKNLLTLWLLIVTISKMVIQWNPLKLRGPCDERLPFTSDERPPH